MTVAQLGIEVTSAPAKRAVADLDSLTASAGRTEAAVESMGRSASTAIKATGGGLSDFSKRVQQAANDTESMSARVTAAHRQNAFAMKNFAYQANDVVTGLLTGQRPMQVLLQQGGQIQQVFGQHSGGATGVLRDFGASLRGLANPATLAIGGIVAVAAAVAAAALSWKNYALAVDDVARRSGTTAESLSRLQAAAAFKGIGQEDFFASSGKFAENVYLAQRNMGGLAELFRANNVQAKTFDQYLERVADLIQRAATEEGKYRVLEQAGLPATAQWVRYLGQGAEGLRLAKQAAVDFGTNDALVKKARDFDDAMNRAWTNSGRAMRQFFIDFYDFMQKADAKTSGWGINLRQVALAANPATWPLLAVEAAGAISGRSAPTANDRVKSVFQDISSFPGMKQTTLEALKSNATTKDVEVQKDQIAKYQQLIGLLGPLATVQQQVKAKENEITIARLAGVNVTKDQARAIIDYTQVQAELARQQEGIALGIFNEATARRLANQEIDISRQRGIIKTVEDEASARAVLTKRIREAGEAATVARSPFEQLTRYSLDSQNLAKQIDQFATSAFSSFENSFADVIAGTKSVKAAFTDMASSILRDLSRLLIRQSITGPLAGLLSGGLGSIFGGGGASAASDLGALNAGFLGSARGNIFQFGNVVPFARGGVITSPIVFPMARGMGLAGEAGPEAVVPLRRTSRGDLGIQIAGANDNGGRSPVVHAVFAPTYNVTGTTEDIQQLRAQMARDRAEFESRTIAAVRGAQSRRALK